MSIEGQTLDVGTSSVTVNYTVVSGSVSPSPQATAVPPDPGTVIFGTTVTGTVTGGSITANPSLVTVALPGSITC